MQLPGQPISHISEVALLANRMNVESRPQDMGHVSVDGEMPPPDYGQATEPYNLSRRS